MDRLRLSFVLSGLGAVLAFGQAAQPAGKAVPVRFMEAPAGFEVNAGQAGHEVDFISQGLKHRLSLNRTGVRLNVGRQQATGLDINLVGARQDSVAHGVDLLPVTSNYFRGSDPSQSVVGIANYAKVRYQRVWPGVDVVYYGNQNRLEYDFVVAPGANPSAATVEFQGAQKLSVNSDGDLVIKTSAGELIQNKPVAYQMSPQGRTDVPAHYLIQGSRVSVAIAAYNHASELIIDPVLGYSLTRMDTDYQYGTAIVTDGSGNSFLTGTTYPVSTTAGSSTYYRTAWVLGYDIVGNTLIKFTLAASDGDMFGNGIAVDNASNLYITGTILGAHFFLRNAFQSALSGPSDAFLTKVHFANHTADIVFSTYLGGSSAENGNAVAVDTSGNVYVAGSTYSANFPGNQGNAYAGALDAFVAKFTGSGSLVYSYLAGGTLDDSANSVAVDAGGNLYVAGSTTSANFRTTGSTGYSLTKSTGSNDGFLLKLNSSTLAIGYFTFFTFGPFNRVAVDTAGNAYLAGSTQGAIPTNSVNSGYQLIGTANHAFLARFNTNTNGVNSYIYGSTLGGSGLDTGLGVGADNNGNAVIVGRTASPNFPVTGSPLQGNLSGPGDGFLSRFNTNASGSASLTYSTYMGGSSDDSLNAVALSAYGNPVVTGYTSSPNFPVPPGTAADTGTQQRAITAKLHFEAAPFGSFDTPTNNTTNVSGALNTGGWALSPIGIANVAIWRDPVNGEATAPNGLVFISNAIQVPGARPDVAAAFPGYPNNNYGWGVQILTNELPGTGGKPIGNGTYRLHAIATDNDGLSAEIGASTITVNNAGSLLPFGTIDTPRPGEVVSGSAYVNFGWVVTPQPAMIPIDGSTITVYIDNQPVGHPTYNQYRSDIATLFPNLKNSNGAVGYFMIDSTKLSNGLHTISWTATDDAGHSAGLGSRYFIVQN